MVIIYKATNKVNNKCYIGFDSRWPKRKHEHKSDALRNKDNCIFHRAIRKYGWHNFTWEILYQSKDFEHTLKIIEPLLVKEFYANNNQYGYNMTAGGEGSSRSWSQEQKRAQSNRLLGKKKIRTTGRFVYKIITPYKQEIIIDHLNRYAKTHNLDPSALYQVAKGNLLHYKQYQVFKLNSFSPNRIESSHY